MLGNAMDLSLSNRYVGLRSKEDRKSNFYGILSQERYCQESFLNVTYQKLALVEDVLKHPELPNNKGQLIEASSGRGEDAVEGSKRDKAHPVAATLRSAHGFASYQALVEKHRGGIDITPLLEKLQAAEGIAWKDHGDEDPQVLAAVTEVLDALEKHFFPKELQQQEALAI